MWPWIWQLKFFFHPWYPGAFPLNSTHNCHNIVCLFSLLLLGFSEGSTLHTSSLHGSSTDWPVAMHHSSFYLILISFNWKLIFREWTTDKHTTVIKRRMTDKHFTVIKRNVIILIVVSFRRNHKTYSLSYISKIISRMKKGNTLENFMKKTCMGISTTYDTALSCGSSQLFSIFSPCRRDLPSVQ